MSGSITPIAPAVGPTGISVSDYPTILAYYVAQFRAIYGADTYLEADSQDGQWLGILGLVCSDFSSAAVAAFASFSPATAQGTGLSSVVKINGLQRLTPSNSQVDVIIGGAVGTTITNGSITDQNDVLWTLPASVLIPPSGTITVTATCSALGPVAASPGTQWSINTLTRGWTSVTNTSAGTPGAPVETDATLRQRQAASTMLPSSTVVDGIRGAILALAGVTRFAVDENDTTATDANGVPAGATCFVVEGGDATQIATVIADKKTMGAPTYGSTTETVNDSAGISRTINFDRPTETTFIVMLGLIALTGYTDAIGAAAAAQVAAYIQALPIGATIYIGRLYSLANLSVSQGGGTYDVSSIQIARSGGTPAASNIALAFNEAPNCAPSNVTVSASS